MSNNMFDTAIRLVREESREEDETNAIQRIKDECQSKDYEGNGCNLDKIIYDFLVKRGFKKLADETNNVECWRA